MATQLMPWAVVPPAHRAHKQRKKLLRGAVTAGHILPRERHEQQLLHRWYLRWGLAPLPQPAHPLPGWQLSCGHQCATARHPKCSCACEGANHGRE